MSVENVAKIKESALAIFAEAKVLEDQLDELKNWDSLSEVLSNISKLSDFATKVILAVEISSNELGGMTGEDKLDTATQIIDDALVFPWYMESFDGPMIKLLLSTLVDQFNKYAGKKEWDLGKAKTALLENDVVKFLKG